jgi:hypothetical protein
VRGMLGYNIDRMDRAPETNTANDYWRLMLTKTVDGKASGRCPARGVTLLSR